MRVIAGKARSLKLQTLDGLNTRPTTDRIKETLFNMIQHQIGGCAFLDLFSGSGAIGIEALSRGADCVCFVENNKKAVMCIQNNLKFTKLGQGAIVYPMTAGDALAQMEREEKKFDIIFMDPPYNLLLEKEVLTWLAKSCLIDEDTTIIVEADIDTDFSYIDSLGFYLCKEKKYSTNKHVFLKKD